MKLYKFQLFNMENLQLKIIYTYLMHTRIITLLPVGKELCFIVMNQTYCRNTYKWATDIPNYICG